MKKTLSADINKYKISKCRICGGHDLFHFLSLSSMPIPNGFVKKEDLKIKEEYYPLDVCVCQTCWLVQLSYVVPAEIMFKNYLYIPSTSTTMMSHFKALSDEVSDTYHLNQNDLVIDIGSNDGALLCYFKEHQVKTLGIDPAKNLALVARLKGIDTIADFFSLKLARKLIKNGSHAKIITATNVLAHVDDLHDLIEGVRILLDDNGIFICEFPYLAELLDKNEFDTIYHEHLSYFSILPVIKLLSLHQMKIIDIKRSSIHGGSLRVYISKENSSLKESPTVSEYSHIEIIKKLTQKETYRNFAKRVKAIKASTVQYLSFLKKQGKTIVGYGASAKGNVLLNYCNIKSNILDYIVDSIPYKQGRFTPGTHIPIVPESVLLKEMPDYTIILAWNFADEIMNKQNKYREKGGRFILTIPALRIE
jgi:hypothetical protein